ncbi:hypothetical protein Hanom_Chr12g01071521 [Helianthus anomalus]
MSKLGAKCVTKCKPQGPSIYFWENLGTKCITKCKPQGPSMYFWKARDQIQNFGKPRESRVLYLY